jgi:hypothetical protein
VLSDYNTNEMLNQYQGSKRATPKNYFPVWNTQWAHESYLSPDAGLVLWQNFSRHIRLSNISIMPTLANHAVIFSESFPPCGYYYELFSSCESITNFPLHPGNNLKGDMHAKIGLHSIIKFKNKSEQTITHTCLIQH